MSEKVSFILTSDRFFPLFFSVSECLQSHNVDTSFFTVTRREHLLLKKNRLEYFPSEICNINKCPTHTHVLTESDIETVMKFSAQSLPVNKERLRDRVLYVAAVASRYILSYKPYAIIVWNGSDAISQTVIHIAKQHNVRVIYMENGYFNKTLQLDFMGVNTNSSVKGMSFFEIRSKSNREILFDATTNFGYSIRQHLKLSLFENLACFILRVMDPFFYYRFPELKGVNSRIGDFFRKFELLFINKDTIVLPDKFIFIPLQVHTDTQILLNSTHFHDMESFIIFCHDAIIRNFGYKYKIVVKEHPEDILRKSYEEIKRRFPDIIWLRNYDLQKIIDNASLVFVINSSVGLQAVQKHKAVVVFGESFYARDEIVFTVRNLNDVDDVIKKAEIGLSAESKKDMDLFIKYLNEEYFVPGGWKHFSAMDIERICGRILDYTDGSAWIK